MNSRCCAMKASQIRTILSRKKNCHNVLVRASNELPRGYVYRRPQTFIVNTQPNYKRGMHWVVIHLPRTNTSHFDDRPCFFDPLGFSPSSYNKNFVNFIHNNMIRSRSYFRNTSQVQHQDSRACGMYCLYFVMLLRQDTHSHIDKEGIIHKMSLISEEKIISDILA